MTSAPTRRGLLGAAGLSGLTSVGLLGLSGCSRTGGSSASGATPTPAFPSFAPASLTARQRAVIDVLRTQYRDQPPASRYTPVSGEPWCADFVSWVEKASGSPLRNPNTGGWRIPGTMTLLDHLRATHAWHAADSGYIPVPGDIAIYDGDGPFGQHTNFVLGLASGRLTTIGGNEGARSVTISTHDDDAGLGCLGFGHRTQ